MSHLRPRLGAHMSIAGGVHKALERGASLGCETIQIFTKSNLQWQARPLGGEEVRMFRTLRRSLGIDPVVAHAAYLVNLASPDTALWERSLEAFIIELRRCVELEIPGVVVHPGAHSGAGEVEGIRRVARALDKAFQAVPEHGLQVWLETTAGQGSGLGHRFEQLRDILELTSVPERVGFCFDTAHVAAAGYDIRTPAGCADTLRSFDTLLGLERLRVFHLNDSRREVGSRLDRHEHIGKGTLGLEPFRMILNDARFAGLPMLLETPKGKDMAEDVENLRLLRSLFA